ncbi:acyl-CoA dehydrogenase [Nitratireductor aestuarii]|uniref:Acyl-CoA dehydrogenase n=1 Tax=Nitratireductor aestuarii TaxID=1735103 RepID=A0A916S1B5_9HYPH|nr:acyl-CoA dehydrogenase family protein [Nitratireductor aestuarii]GGA78984.1 acyl-CoA dehydrogenase [Nitratireductor aestuarii]
MSVNALTEELEAFRRTVRRFLAEEVAPNVQQYRSQRRVPPEVWKKAGDVGLLGVSIPAEYGGIGGEFRHEIVIMEELARIAFFDFGVPLHNAIVAPYITRYGSEEQKQKWLPRLTSGEMIGAIAMTEPGTGSDLQGIRTKAERSGNGFVLNGQKTFITNGQNANLIIVAAKTDPSAGSKGTSLFIVETENVAGFRRGRNLEKIGFHGQDTSELFFDNVALPADALLGDSENRGFYQLMEQLPQERLLIAVQALAAAETALETTIDYVKQRKAFGKAVLDFQNTRFVLAEAKTELTIGKAFVAECIEKLGREELDATTAAMAKWWCTQKQCEIIDECLQLHGGYGYMAEYPIAHMWADARVQKIYGGTNEIMKDLIARTL